MPTAVDIVALFVTSLPAAFWMAALVATLRNVRSIERLDAAGGAAAEPVSVVTPACDEAEQIATSVATFLAQGPHVRVVAVDDRSTDGTGAILDALAAAQDRLDVVHLAELPAGWLGKVHALHVGAQRATGDWLVFADADVAFAPGTIDRAVYHASTRGLDCLTLIPRVHSAGPLGDLVFEASDALVGLAGRWWAVRDPDSKAFVGGGAFMLIRRAAFERTPGFEWLRLEVADDQGLGLMMKRHGATDIAVATDAVTLRWYADYGDLARKMQKGFFGILGRFSAARTLAVAAALAWVGAFPLAALLTDAPVVHCVAAVGLLLMCTTAVVAARWLGRSVVSAVLAPLGFLLLAAAVTRAAWIGWRVGGIQWRGQRYASAELRGAQRVSF